MFFFVLGGPLLGSDLQVVCVWCSFGLCVVWGEGVSSGSKNDPKIVHRSNSTLVTIVTFKNSVAF